MLTLPSKPAQAPTQLGGAWGSYALVELLSSNAGVSMYRASGLGQQLAIKLATELSGSRAVEQERVALTALQCPRNTRLPLLVDGGQADGLAWFATAWAGERTLRDYLDCSAAALSHAEAASIVHALSQALVHVHAAGWVHGDVNPRNVVMGESGATLVDFGSARCLAGRATSLRDPPERGTATPGYIAPERLLGRAWDSRADVYALGCIWFELLTGGPVFQGADAESLSRQHSARAIPSILAVVRDLEVAHATLLASMLSKDPHNRPAALRDIEDALGQALELAPAGRQAQTPLFESRLFGRTEAWSTLRRHVNEAAEGNGGATLVVGARGAGRTRLLAETAELAAQAGLDTIDLSPVAAAPDDVATRAEIKLGWLAIADDVSSSADLQQVLSRTAELGDAQGGLLLVAADEQLLESGFIPSAAFRVLHLTALSRDASRRVVSDICAGPVEEGLQTLLWRKCLGNPARIRKEIEALRCSGRMARGADGMWCLAATFECPEEELQPVGEVAPAEHLALARALEASSVQDHAQIAGHYSRAGDSRRALLHLRRAAAQERRRSAPDENRVNQFLEAALVELRPVVELSPRGRRVALRLGYKLLRRLSRAADHNSVHALSRELTAWCTPAQSRLEAKIRRLDALSYRVVGENAEALQQLQLALSCLDRASEGAPRLNELERILNRLAASWAHYSAHNGESSLAAAKSTFASVRAVGTPAQRAEALLHAGKALALIERYRCSSRVVRLERRAVAVLRRHAAPALAQVSALGNLAFILLLGDASQCREAVEIYEYISEKARKAGDVLELTRVATYLAVGYRRVGRLRECEAQSRLTLELSRQCGQPGYVGVARACLGWLALRRSETALAASECRTALQVWQRRRLVDPSRTTEYPFQWLGILPIIAAQVASESAANCAAWLDDLLHPTQALLAQPLQACLERGATEGSNWSAEAWDDWGDKVVRLATAHHYL